MRIDIINRVDVGKPIRPVALQDVLFYGDNNAHRIIAEVYKDGEKADLTGAGVQGYIVLSDGTTVLITGSVGADGDGDNCRAYVDLIADCYAVEGRAAIFLKITGTNLITTTLALYATVSPTYTANIVTQASTIPDISDLLAEIAAMQAATAALDVDNEQTLCLASAWNKQNLKIDDAMSAFGQQYCYLNSSGVITRSASTSVDVRTSLKLVAVPGDTISYTLSETTTGGRLIFAVFDKDGNLSHSKAAAGVDTMVSEEYTFGTGDAYFWISGRYGKRASYTVTYTPAMRE